MIGLVGLVALYGAAYLLSTDRRAVSWRLVAWGIALQLLFALAILKWPPGQAALAQASAGVRALLEYADQGSAFVFGQLADPEGPAGMVFAFRVLPIVIFISALFSVLYYLGVMQRVVLFMAKTMHRLMGVSGSESLAAAANVFMGQTEAPIIIAPYVPRMTQSELMALMTGGMATVSGAVLASYIGLGVRAEYLLAASVMAAPASLVMAKLMIPETQESVTAGDVSLEVEAEDVNVIDAAARGAAKGIQLALNIGGMLVAFVALIYLIDGILAGVGNAFASLGNLAIFLVVLGAGVAAWTLFWDPSRRARRIGLALSGAVVVASVATFVVRGPGVVMLGLRPLLGGLFSPLAYLMGVPWQDAASVGELLGVKIVLNEFVAYVELGEMLDRGALTPRGEMIVSYALCGFANFSSIGIQIGGIGPLAPSRKSDLARLGLRAMVGGMMASMTVATLAGLLSTPAS